MTLTHPLHRPSAPFPRGNHGTAAPPAPARAPAPAPGPGLRAVRTATRAPLGPLVRRTDVGDVAWQLLLRDGHLVPVLDDVAVGPAVRLTPALRAAALAARVPVRCAVARGTAVWVHVGGPPPDRLHVLAPRRTRRPEPQPGRTAAVAELPAADVVVLGGVRVTTPRRTAVDLLSHEPPEVALPLVARLRNAGLDPARVRADVAAAAGRRGVRAAAALLHHLPDAWDAP